MASEQRSECKQCGVHTFRMACGNCGSTALRAVPCDGDKSASRRFASLSAQRLSGAMSGRGLRSGSVL